MNRTAIPFDKADPALVSDIETALQFRFPQLADWDVREVSEIAASVAAARIAAERVATVPVIPEGWHLSAVMRPIGSTEYVCCLWRDGKEREPNNGVQAYAAEWHDALNAAIAAAAVTHDELRERVAVVLAENDQLGVHHHEYLEDADAAIRAVIGELAQEADGAFPFCKGAMYYDEPRQQWIGVSDWLRRHLPEVAE
jgi:hypothetical protein